MLDGMPTLSSGAHEPGEGKACVMEYVALLAGEPWTDSPACTHPMLARMAQAVNDRLSDDERHKLVPLIGRLFGTAPVGTDHERCVLSVRLACWAARQVLHLAVDQRAALLAIETAEAWCEGHTSDEVSRVGTAAQMSAQMVADVAAVAAAEASADAAYAAHAAAEASSAYATRAHAAHAYATHAADEVTFATCVVAGDLVALLTGLLDEYDRLTGRTTSRAVSSEELSMLQSKVLTASS